MNDNDPVITVTKNRLNKINLLLERAKEAVDNQEWAALYVYLAEISLKSSNLRKVSLNLSNLGRGGETDG